MAIDFEITARLAKIAEKLETRAGITPDAGLVRDVTITSRLKRIEDAIQGGAFEAHTLGSHLDVSLPSPVDGEYLRYEAAGSEWVADAIDLASLPTIPHNTLSDLSDDDHTQYLLADGSRALTAPWDSQDKITATSLCIDSTIDHSITNESGALVFTNFNSDQDVIMRINDGGVIHDFWTLDASIPSIVFEPTGGTGQIVNEGILVVKGSYRGPAAWGVMDFSPTSVQGTSYGFFIRPTYDGSLIGEGVHCQPTIAAGQGLNYSAYVMQMPMPAAGFNANYTLIKDVTQRAFIALSGTKVFTGLKYGSSVVSAAGDTSAVTDTGVDLTGGVSNFASMTITQYGLRLRGYGSVTGAGTTYGIHADGGEWLMASDTGRAQFGASTDAEIGYNGTNFVIDPDLVGAGIVLIGATGDDDMRLTNIEIDGALNHDGATVGLFGTAPVAQSTGWSTSNVSSAKVLDADSVTLHGLADIVGTLIDYLLTRGDLGA